MQRLAGRPLLVVGVAFLLEFALALAFSRASLRDRVGGPVAVMLAMCLAASFAVGVVGGVVLTVAASLLAVALLDANPYFTTAVWVGLAVLAGRVGEALLHGEQQRAELEFELQAGLLPLASTRQGALLVAERYVPAESRLLLAGDFYGVVDDPRGRLALLVGDVSGHGPVAAALSTHLRATWRGLVVAGSELPTIMRVLNETMHAERVRVGDEAFATVCLARLDPAARTADFLVAGHHPPLLLTTSGARHLQTPAGPPLGVVQGMPWASKRLALPPVPWSLFFYTDGLSEAHHPARGRLGDDGLCELVARETPPLGERQLDQLLGSVIEANGGPIEDDVVMLAVSDIRL